MDLTEIPSKIDELRRQIMSCASEGEKDGWHLVKQSEVCGAAA